MTFIGPTQNPAAQTFPASWFAGNGHAVCAVGDGA